MIGLARRAQRCGRARKGMALVFGLLLIFLLASCAGKKYPPPSRDINQPVIASYAAAAPAFDGKLQIIAFNIERGFYWPDIVKYIEDKRADLPATIVLLSECDRNHSRTQEVFVADAMAKALAMNMAFATEFIEYNDETPENQGDHGNAILSPFPMSDITVIRLPTFYSWEKLGSLKGEPRFGDRVTIGATIQLPDGRAIRVYSTHLESYAETVGKWIQLSRTVQDAEQGGRPFVIGGDFNEVPGGLMFAMLPLYGVKNSFTGDLAPTGGCKPGAGRAECVLKIDWIVHKDVDLVDRFVDYPLNSQGGVISDHAPVRAIFRVK